MKKILFILLILTILVSTTAIAANELSLKDFDVTVDGHSANGVDEDGGKIEVYPGDEIIIEARIENTYSRSEDIEIEDIEVELYIKDLGHKDIDIKEDVSDIDANDDLDITLTFQVPYLLDDGIYDMEFIVNGEDDNGSKHEIEQTFVFKVKKENDELSLVTFEPVQEPLVCGDLLQLSYHLVNTGDDNQKNTEIKVLIDDLNYKNIVLYDFMTDFDDDDDEMEFKTILDIDLTELQKSLFTARIEVTNDDDVELITDYIEIAYTPCVVEKTIEEKEEELKKVVPKVETNQETVVTGTNSNNNPVTTESSASTTEISYSKITKTTKPSLFTTGNILLLTLILLIIVLIVLATNISSQNKNK